jgi:hypothetical protein
VKLLCSILQRIKWAANENENSAGFVIYLPCIALECVRVRLRRVVSQTERGMRDFSDSRCKCVAVAYANHGGEKELSCFLNS